MNPIHQKLINLWNLVQGHTIIPDMADNMEKSNRAAADYFELRVAKWLSELYKTGDNFDAELEKNKKLALTKRGGSNKIIMHDAHFEGLKSSDDFGIHLNEFISLHGNAKKIEWVGRNHKTIRSKADVFLTAQDGKKLGISLKSVKTGKGTLDNAGSDMSKTLGVEISEKIAQMQANLWDKIRKSTMGKEIKNAKWTQLRKLKHHNKKLVEFGKEVGLPVQRFATSESAAKFNELPKDKRLELVKKILGVNTPDKLIFATISGKNKTVIVSDSEINEILNNKELHAKVKGPKKYSIEAGGKPLIGTQSSFTNGIGLSAFCQRSFLDWK